MNILIYCLIWETTLTNPEKTEWFKRKKWLFVYQIEFTWFENCISKYRDLYHMYCIFISINKHGKTTATEVTSVNM